MRNGLHRTVIGVVRDYVDRWRRAQGLSLQTAAQLIVDEYQRREFQRVWDVEFRTSGDAYGALKANSERIWRWLDDQTKDTTLLPANFLPVVLAVLPPDLRLMCVGELLAPVGLTVGLQVSAAQEHTHARVLGELARETGQAIAALAVLADGWNREELLRAHAELTESLAASQQALLFIGQVLAGEGHAAG